jgi:hypothetical protein
MLSSVSRGRKERLFMDRLSEVASELAVRLDEVSRPIIDGRTLDGELRDAFLPIDEEKDVEPLMKRTSELLDRLQRKGEDLSEIRHRFECTLKELDVLIARRMASLGRHPEL